MRRLLLLAFCLLASTNALAQSHPTFWVTAADDARYAAMKANYDANPSSPTQLGGQIYKFIKTQADCACRDSDRGQWATLIYHISGDTTYATLAWNKINSRFLNLADTFAALGGNYIREFGWQHAWMYDWLYPALTAEQRTAYMDKINTMNTVSGYLAFGPTDSDQTAGQYFSAAMWYLATNSYNATAGTIWNDADKKFGGYTATAADTTTHRNAIRYYAEVLGAGGVWPESSEYNMGTMKIVCLGASAMKSAQTPTDNFPELTTFCNDAALAGTYEIVPGLDPVNGKIWKWGDAEHFDLPETYYRAEQAFMLAGVSNGLSNGPVAQDYAMRYVENAASGLTTLDPYPRGFIVFDPAATRGDSTASSESFHATGTETAIRITGWSAGESLFGARFPPAWNPKVDHMESTFGEFQIWDGTAWAIDKARTYGGPGTDVRGTNGLSMRGAPIITTYPVLEYHGNTQYEDDPTNGFTYYAGTQGGAIVPSNYYNPPPSMIQEDSRSLVWLPSVKSLVVFDRANVKSAADGACSDGLLTNPPLKQWVDSRARKELHFYSRNVPTTATGYTEYTYIGTRKTRINHLLPESYTRTVDDLSTVWVTGYYQLGSVNAAEKKYGMRLIPAVDQRFDTFLNVWNYYGDGTPVTTMLVQDTTALVDAALVTGDANYLLAFNAIQGQDIDDMPRAACPPPKAGAATYSGNAASVLDTVRLRTAGYTLSFTAPAGGTKALLFDLNHNNAWQYSLNGGDATELTVSDQDIGVVDIPGSGATTLEVIGAGALPVTIQTSALPSLRKGTAMTAFDMDSLGGAGSPDWSVSAGTEPTGLSLSAGGQWTGTPTVADTFNFTVQACDPSPTNCGTRDYSWTVQDVPAITTTSLDDCNQGSAYSDTLAATGGTEPYTFSVQSGTLPTGLSLNAGTGAITGTCTGSLGLVELTFRVTDDSAATGDKDLGITVQSPLPSLAVRVQPGSSSAVVQFGISALAYEDSCDVNLREGETILQTETSTAGSASRLVTFSNLQPDRTFNVDVVCGSAATDQSTYFRTSNDAGGDTSYTLKIRLPDVVKARATALDADLSSLKLYLDMDGTPAATTYTSGCNQTTQLCEITTSLATGIHYYSWYWDVNGGTVLATTAHRPAYVAIP